MSAKQQINGLGPSSFPKYPLEVSLHQEIPSSDFTSGIFALSNTTNALTCGLLEDDSFLPATIVVSAPGDWDDDRYQRDRHRAMIDTSTPEAAPIVRIGTWNGSTEEWVHSEIYVEGMVVSRTREAEIRKRFDWFDGQR